MPWLSLHPPLPHCLVKIEFSLVPKVVIFLFCKIFIFLFQRSFRNVNMVSDLWKLTKLFRSPEEMAALKAYFVDDEMKDHVLECYKAGFVSHFEYPLPEP